MGEHFKNFATVEPTALDVAHRFVEQRWAGERPIGAASNSGNA